jgi:PAS domain S-box-containing protein
MNPARILIVEDETIVALDVKNRLIEMGYEVAGLADRGDLALDLVSSTHCDLVLMDIRIKGDMDGIAVAEEIRKRWAIPVIYLTAFSEESTLQRAKVTEPYGYIIKPFEDREIQSAIEMALYKHQAEKRLRESERRFATTLTSIGDGVIATDAAGRVTFMNPVAQRLTGWSLEEYGGRPLAEIFRIVNELTRETVEDPVAKVLRMGNSVGLANHTLLIARDGREIPIDDCAAPIFDDNGAVSGTVLVFQDVSERRRREAELRRIEWMLSPRARSETSGQPALQHAYGDLTALNGRRVILDAVGPGLLKDVVSDYLDLLETSAAVYESNGDYAFGIFSYGWCRFMDQASRDGCHTPDNSRALAQGRWHCHESCWTMASRQSIIQQGPVDIECLGGIRLYAVPIRAGEEIVGSINFGYGDPPRDPVILEELAQRYGVDVEALATYARAYESRPRFIIELAKRRLEASARLIGEIVNRKRLEEALRDSEERFRGLFDRSNDCVYLCDFNGRFLDANQAALDLLGYGRHEIGTLNFASLMSEEGLPLAWRAVEEIKAGNLQKRVSEYRLRRQDGAYVDVETQSSLVYRHGKPFAIQGIARDITDRKRMEKEREEALALLQTSIAQSPSGILIASAPEGTIRWANPAALAIRGSSELPLTGISIDRHASNWQTFQMDGRIYPTEELPLSRAILKGEITRDEEVIIRNDRGENRWVSVNAAPVRDSKGVITSGIVIFHDITDRKLAEVELKRSHQTLIAVLNGIDAAIYVADMQNYEILFMNKFMIDAFGADFTGRTCHEAFRKEDAPCIQCANPQLVDEAGQPTGAYIWQSQNPVTGKYYINHDRAIHWLDGRIVRLQISTDISLLKEMEQERDRIGAQLIQAQKMESVGRLAGGVAHDFNNMLGVILGRVDLGLLKAEPGHPIHETLKEIQKAAQRSAELTRQLLAFARRQTVAPKILDLNDTVAGMLRILQRLIGEDIDFAWKPGPGLGPVKIDPSQIDQMLANLCVNARDAITGVGKITIETENVFVDEAYCAVHPGFVRGPYVMLAVSDDGRGMDKETMEHIFEPFFTTKEIGKGTGLGLATVYGIVKQNDGCINVYSEPGKGTTFKIYLPRVAGDPSTTAPENSVPIYRGKGETVLLVEDEEYILKVGQEMLEKLGYRVIPAGTPGEALRQAMIHAGKIQLIITDVVMPEMNGRELVKALGEIQGGMKSLYMSGYTANVIAHRGVLDEGVQFLQKPFSINDLAFKVHAALKGH